MKSYVWKIKKPRGFWSFAVHKFLSLKDILHQINFLTVFNRKNRATNFILIKTESVSEISESFHKQKEKRWNNSFGFLYLFCFLTFSTINEQAAIIAKNNSTKLEVNSGTVGVG